MATMRKIVLLTVILASSIFLSACNKSGESTEKSAAPANAAASNASDPAGIKNTVDVGKIEQVVTTADGSGNSPSAALSEALKLAIMQVNGVTVNASTDSLNISQTTLETLDVESSEGSAYVKAASTLQSQQFADRIITESKGAISSFKVLSVTPPEKKGDLFKVQIEAKIAKFSAPSTAGKLKIVVAPLHTNKASFNIGGRQIPAQDVLTTIHQQIVDALTQTGRFLVLDRQFEGELQNELELIGSGQTPNTDFAKLGQAASADLIWVGVVNDFAYEKHVRHLELAERDLVSFSGGWSISQRMINLATRQILQSVSLKGNAPATAPTTLGTNPDQVAIVKSMSVEMVTKAVEAILLKTFPISVAERDGDSVVLSQGGNALRENSRYMVYLLGKEIKDPQTGLSLGNIETACCEVLVNRVTPNLSYGTLQNIKVKLDGVQPGALQIREVIGAALSKPAADTQSDDTKATGKKASAIVGKSANSEKKSAEPSDTKKKDDW